MKTTLTLLFAAALTGCSFETVTGTGAPLGEDPKRSVRVEEEKPGLSIKFEFGTRTVAGIVADFWATPWA